MSIYEGLSEPNQKNFMYAATPVDKANGDLTNAILNTKNTGWRALKNKMLEVIAPINPFHLRQDLHPHGYNVSGIKTGNFFYRPVVYPFNHKITYGEPNHYDPTTDIDSDYNAKFSVFSMGTQMHLNISQDKVPYVCEVKRKELSNCYLVNEGSKCQTEENNFLEICPNFALRTYRENKIFNEKAKIIQRKEYKEAMKVEDYNKGRTVGDVSKNSSYSMGMASNLRPDSMWVDDRYRNVTQEDINKAKEKLKHKYANFDFKDIKGIHHSHTNEATYTHSPRMY